MVNSHGHFVWYELTTTDMEAAKAFYTEVMGWRTRDASMPDTAYTLFSVGKASVSGLTDLPEEARRMGAAPRWIGYVGVDNMEATVDRIKRLGGIVHVPPTEIPNVSCFSVIADPQMAMLTLVKWLNPAEEQPAALGEPGRVGWHELLAADWEKAFAFYSELFGWRKADAQIGSMGTYQKFSAGGQTIGGMSTKPPMVPVPFWLYYFNTDDIDAAAERVKAGGGRILEGPLEVRGGGRVARCTDPQGAMFALAAMRSNKAIGYFEPAASRDPSAARFFVPKKTVPRMRSSDCQTERPGSAPRPSAN
ncbi:MAG: VOC family protein [Xanthobacteraceae bacterium]